MKNEIVAMIASCNTFTKEIKLHDEEQADIAIELTVGEVRLGEIHLMEMNGCRRLLMSDVFRINRRIIEDKIRLEDNSWEGFLLRNSDVLPLFLWSGIDNK